jgi:hypothetical protein
LRFRGLRVIATFHSEITLMTRHSLVFLALLFSFAWTARDAQAARSYFTVTYPPATAEGELQMGVTYTVWIPAGVAKLRGVIVHQHGCGVGACKGGETAAYDLHWQALAKKWDCALLGPSYHQAEQQNCRLWCDPRNGSRQTFLRSLHDLAALCKHPELEQVPWCLWGHSGGGFWASLMQTSDPDRIVAIWFRSGTAFPTWEKGEIPKPTISDTVYSIPMMCNPGAKEKDDKRFNGAWTGSLAMFRAYRAEGAPIGFAPDPNSSHDCGVSRYLAIRFFDACLAMRLPERGAADQKLRPVDISHAWYAPVEGTEAATTASFTGKKEEAVWLPNAVVAKAWSEYVTDGAVSDFTPPPAPMSVNVARLVTGGFEIRWQAEADLESGLREFVILRDGTSIGTVPSKSVAKLGRAQFQPMSYHDTPEAPLGEMIYRDDTAAAGALYRYEVRAVNTAGLKSAPASAPR